MVPINGCAKVLVSFISIVLLERMWGRGGVNSDSGTTFHTDSDELLCFYDVNSRGDLGGL
jgi:hypothetical protein